MATKTGETSFVPDPGEQVIDEYATVGVVGRIKGVRDAGRLIITSQRVLFYRQEGVFKKTTTMANQVPLWALKKIGAGKASTGPGRHTNFIDINGDRYFLAGADSKPLANQLKALAKAAQKAKQTGISQPVPSIQTPASNIAPAPVAPSPVAKNVVYCSSCGKPNEKTSQFCGGCGEKLQ